MKKLLSLSLALVLILALAIPAFAESSFIETDGFILRVRDDGSGEEIHDNLEDLLPVLAVQDLDEHRRFGPLQLTLESLFVAEMIVEDDARAQIYYNAWGGAPFTFIRFAFTVENTGDVTLTLPRPFAWIVTSDGEIVDGRIGSRSSGEKEPSVIAPGETQRGYLFFFCPETLADYMSFFSLFLERPTNEKGSAYGVRTGLCFELQGILD